MVNDARVKLWGTSIGAVSWLEERELGVFQYDPDFLPSGIQLAPLTMPLGSETFAFPGLPRNTFKGLPGMLADALPDAYGNALIDAWLASQGRAAGSFHPVERLCYIGQRAMGALEFEPATHAQESKGHEVEVEQLVELANRVLDQKAQLQGVFSGEDDHEAIGDILRVGTSAGGARAKAILAWNPKTNAFRSGQVPQRSDYEAWLIKFDGVSGTGSSGVQNPMGYGKIEFAYHRMAMAAGIEMAPCRLHHEGGRSHFMTKRFDRTASGDKLHMQSLGAIAHLDFNAVGAASYEQAMDVIRRLGLSRLAAEEQVRRAFFNVVARNCDDHVKNIAFLMDRGGRWQLSPAFDVSFAYNPQGLWTSQHQMRINGKRRDFEREDLFALASKAGMKRAAASRMLDQILDAVRQWPDFADQAGVEPERMEAIRKLQVMEWS
jgi:serine/threonine-protein kinase HipA